MAIRMLISLFLLTTLIALVVLFALATLFALIDLVALVALVALVTLVALKILLSTLKFQLIMLKRTIITRLVHLQIMQNLVFFQRQCLLQDLQQEERKTSDLL